METRPSLTPERMIAIAVARGVTLDSARAEMLQPAVASLLARLEQLSRTLSPSDPVGPGPLDTGRR